MPEDPYAHMIPGSDAACFLLQREHANVQIVARFTVTGEPVSKARARFTKTGHSYTPDATRTAENQVAWRFRAASKSKAPDGANAFGVFGIFFAATQQRRDVDNMLKLLLDALNKVAWADDSQVTEISGRKVLVDEPSDARTEVVVYRLGPVHVRTGTCEHCGGTFPAFRSQKARRFCSRECDQARRALARLRTCPRCATRFDPKHHTQKYCTPACKRADHSVDATCVECGNQYRRWLSHARQSVDACTPQCRQAYWSKHSAKNSQGTCAACGGSTSKKTYTRCRPCVMSGRQIVRTAPQDVAPPGRVVLTIRELP